MDDLTPEQRHRSMSHIRSSNTSIEVLLRKALWQKGYRYRKNDKRLPGKPDIVIPKYRIAIFCDSEFFHGKDWEYQKLKLIKGNNSQYWIGKIQGNIARDSYNDKRLRSLDWTVLRFWGNDIKKHLDECVRAVDEAAYEYLSGSKEE